MAECVRVICRCRPFNVRETDLKSKACVQMYADTGQVVLQSDNSEKQFTFDGVYPPESTSEQIYDEIVFPLVESVIEGYNGTVFAYGQTGSGKTYTMQGDNSDPQTKGIIPRTFEHIFEATSSENAKFLVHVSYLEVSLLKFICSNLSLSLSAFYFIRFAEVRDLLTKNGEKLEIKEDGENGIYAGGLSLHHCHDVTQCQRLMQIGNDNRHVGATLMNKDSSRSHSIFTIYIEIMLENGSLRKGKLNLVDLAGSERQAKTGTTGERFKEATKINLSLSALGNVISALVSGKAKHIPYRDSKLTRLLQDSLGGNTKTIMVACISPSDNNYDETLSTLRYANRAKNIKNKPRINEDPKDALLREFKAEIERLRALAQSGGQASEDANAIKVEREHLKQEYDAAINELRMQYENEQSSRLKLQEEYEKLKEQYEKASEDLELERRIDNKEAKKRLEILEQQLVGGEQINNVALKEKRNHRIKEAENKMHRLAGNTGVLQLFLSNVGLLWSKMMYNTIFDVIQSKIAELIDRKVFISAALNVHADDPLLHVYSSTQEKLEAVTALYKKQRSKVKSLEAEIDDLQREFELDRVDYLETIRKEEQQIKLLQQILDKIQTISRKDTNYANLDRIKRSASWNEDQGKWIIPEIVFLKTTLPRVSSGIGTY
ncbi:unnamed protein product [Enterobius vermicularis]|uniref:Kinesin-like protein n=1 Tax=Enterobius vermicularis TaxID=51028 RepID=A0A0N4VCV1_ENTVE|nr:unnamed protein product [Enterobius vermicularis]